MVIGLQVLFRFYFPHFYFRLEPAVLWYYTLKGNKQRTLSLEGSILKETNLPFESGSTSVIPSRPRWNRKSISFVWLLQERKSCGPTSCFLYGVFDHGWYEFQLKYWWFCFGFCRIQVPDPASRDLWWHQHGHISNCNHWKSVRKKFFNTFSRFTL